MTTKPANDEPDAPASRQDLVRAKVSGAYATAVDKASTTTRDVIAAAEGNPIALLLGGLALGAAAGTLLPRSAKEKALLAPLGEKIAGAAEAALDAGREAGSKALADNDLSTDALREQVSKLVGQATQAAGAVGTAAVEAARKSVTED